MEEYKVVNEIYQNIETFGLMPTIKRLFGVGTKIKIPFSTASCDTKIEKLELSVRSYNCLKRANLHTVDKIIEAIQEDKLLTIRNLGKNSLAEIHVKIYEFGYDQLCEKHKKEFVKTLLELNKDKYYTT